MRKVSKPLGETIVPPGYGMMLVLTCGYLNLGKNWYASFGNSSDSRAYRVVIYDATEEYKASQRNEKEAQERKQLAALQKKYGK